jgi:hypothetical protein
VVRGYPPALRAGAEPVEPSRAALRAFRTCRAIVAQLSHAFISHFRVPADRPELIESLIRSLQRLCPPASASIACTIGFDARDPRLPIFRRTFGGREYRTQLYVVHWPDDAAAATRLNAIGSSRRRSRCCDAHRVAILVRQRLAPRPATS